MKKRKKDKGSSKENLPVPAPLVVLRFAAGTAVRVKAGTTDPDFDDIPLGGWAGTVRDVQPEEKPPLYLVAWSEETLAGAHPVYRRRCERDGLDLEEAWMAEDDLEPDPGGPVTLEQPTKLRPAPLNQDWPEDRARAVFGLTSDDELPEVDAASLARFHDRLRDRVRFPFAAHIDGTPLMVLRLLPMERVDEKVGLLVEVAGDGGEREEIPLYDVECVEGTVGWRDLEAYRAWLEEMLDSDEYAWLPGPDQPGAGPTSVSAFLGGLGKVVVLSCVLVGAALKVNPDTLLAAEVGAAIVGVFGGFLISGFERMFRAVNRLPPGVFGGLLLGLGGGATVGAAAGSLVPAYLGALPGAIAGTLYANLRGRFGKKQPSVLKATVFGAYLGGLGWLFVQDWWAALVGCGWGLLAGVGLFLAGLVFATVYLNRLLRGVSSNE